MLNNVKLTGSLACGDATRRQKSTVPGTGVSVAARLTGLVASTGVASVPTTGVPSLVAVNAVLPVSTKRERNERPILAPVAGAWAHAYAATGGAEAQVDWAGEASFEAANASTIRTQQTMRAFRGLEPWRDPA